MKEIRFNLEKAEKELPTRKTWCERIYNMLLKYPWSTQREIAIKLGESYTSGQYMNSFRLLMDQGRIVQKPQIRPGGRLGRVYAVKKDAMS